MVCQRTRTHSTHKGSEVGKVNPNKSETCTARVNQTSLVDASVFCDLKTRYQAKMVHTYSGLFMIVSTPTSATLSTNTKGEISILEGTGMDAPHLWTITEGAYPTV